MLSYDGLTQDKVRQHGSQIKLEGLIRQVGNYPGISFSLNSVFTPNNVENLAVSFRDLLQLGVNELLLSLSSY